MAKMMISNRKFLLKWLPFNFCDRFCERCKEFRDECGIYQDDVQYKAQCMVEGKDPHDPKTMLEYAGGALAETMAMLEKSLKKEGVKMTKKYCGEYNNKLKQEEKSINKHPLYRQCHHVSRNVFDFLLSFQDSLLTDSFAPTLIHKEMEELDFYIHPIIMKTDRALRSRLWEHGDRVKFSRPDSLVSATLAFRSLITVEKSLENIREIIRYDEPIWILKINALLRETEKAKLLFQKSFPEIEKFRSKVIFHGK